MDKPMNHPALWLHDEYCATCGYKAVSVYKPDLLEGPVVMTCYKCGSMWDIVANMLAQTEIRKLLYVADQLKENLQEYDILRKKLGYNGG